MKNKKENSSNNEMPAKSVRIYNKWSDAEVSLLRNGGWPAGRTYAQCFIKARQLGVEFHHPRKAACKSEWTDDEIKLLLDGGRPASRSDIACFVKAMELGIEFRTRRQTTSDGCGVEEIDAIMNNKVPAGWTVERARQVAYANGIRSYRPVLSKIIKARSKKDASMAALYSVGNTLAEIGKLYGVSRERVRQCIGRFNRKNCKK